MLFHIELSEEVYYNSKYVEQLQKIGFKFENENRFKTERYLVYVVIQNDKLTYQIQSLDELETFMKKWKKVILINFNSIEDAYEDGHPTLIIVGDNEDKE